MSPTETGTAPWIRIRDAAVHVGETVEIRGWVMHRRSSGKVQFVVLRDGSGQVQCVAGVKDLLPEQWEASAALTQESAVIARGTVKADPRQVGGVELGLSSLEVVSLAPDYPITPKEHGVDFLMDHRHLWLR
jgi:asparaginyl-tRNA synthetase